MTPLLEHILATWVVLFVASLLFAPTEPLWRLGSFMDMLCNIAQFIIIGTLVAFGVFCLIGIWVL